MFINWAIPLMLMGGPLAFETLPTTVGGASATILGVATKQTFEK